MTTHSIRSITVRPRPLIISPGHGPEVCATCGTRSESICNAIDDLDLQRLASVAVVTEVEAGKTFIGEGDPATDFYNITAGHVKLFKLLPDGRRQITGFAQTGVFLGLAGNSTYSFSAEAIDEVRLCRFPRRKMQILMDEFPALEKRLLETASNELVAAQEQMLLLGRKTARERLASFLYARCSHAVACVKSPAQSVTLAMNRSDIADYLGLTIETVSRTFTRLKAEKLIAVPNAATVVVLDVEALGSLADGYESGD
jgi:CRP/FNR family transcriptional regulator